MSSVSINLFDQLSPALQRAIDAVGDLSAPMAEISVKWLETTRSRFNQQIDPMGVPWAPRKDTENKKALLVKDGHLRNQLDNESGPDFAEVGVQDTGGPSEYAAIHNFGGTTRPFRANSKRAYGAFAVVVIPKRQFIGASDSDQANAVQILSDHLQQAFNGDAGAAQ
jgi:phage virion morphogenesis protein